MKTPTLKFTKRKVGYFIGGALLVVGIFGLVSEFLQQKTSEDILFGYVLAGLLIASGVLVCSAICFHYEGGFWLPLGLVLLCGGVAGSALELDDLIRKTQHQALRGVLAAVVLVVAGSLCLFLGHMRHRRVHRSFSNDAV